jgi:predicted O-methyltransferase YrrM
VEKCLTYIESFLSYRNPILGEIDSQYSECENAQPNIGIHVGAFLDWLLHLIGAERVLEFGTCLGYSTVFLGEALRSSGGTLIAVESNQQFFESTRENVEKAGLSGIVRLVHGDAAKIIDDLEGPFDLILQDSAKALYPQMLEQCIQLVRPSGIIAADDGLFKPMGARDAVSQPLHAYNRQVFADPRLISTILPIGDGLTLSIRKG